MPLAPRAVLVPRSTMLTASSTFSATCTPERRSGEEGAAGPPATTRRAGWRESSRRLAATMARAPAGRVAVRHTAWGWWRSTALKSESSGTSAPR